jgi:hypothetical protein
MLIFIIVRNPRKIIDSDRINSHRGQTARQRQRNHNQVEKSWNQSLDADWGQEINSNKHWKILRPD